MSRPDAESVPLPVGVRGRPEGVWVPIITPLTENVEIDVDSLRRLLDHVLPRADGVLALGTTGERAGLTDEQADLVLAVTAEHLAGRRPVMVGVGAVGLADVRRRAARAEQLGADFVAVCAPYYYPLTQRQLVGHFEAVADSSALPVLVYNIPQNTRNPLTPDSVRELAGHEAIVGIKDSSGDLALRPEILALSAPGFSVLQGASETAATRSWSAGVDGYVSGLECVVPGTQAALRDALAGDDTDTAAQIQHVLDRLSRLGEIGGALAGLKRACAILGFGSGRPVPPLSATTPTEATEIAELIADVGTRDWREPQRLSGSRR